MKSTSPAGSMLAQTPAGARVKHKLNPLMVRMGSLRSGTGIFRSRMGPLGPVTATIWSVMVPSGLSSVLSSLKMALAGMG